MRIGTITFHCSYNFGSALQAYALKEYLRRQGHEVSVIDYRSNDFANYWLIRPFGFKTVVADIIFFRKNVKRRNSFHRFWKNYLNLSKHVYHGKKAEEKLKRDVWQYDAVIAGSDQIWNLDCTKGPCPPFFLSFVPSNCKKISYAPSIAQSRISSVNFTDSDKKQISTWLNSFNSISVREISVAEQFQQLTNKKISEVLDPTLLLEAQDYRHIESEILPHKLKAGQFIFAYILSANTNMVTYIDQLAIDKKLTIVYYSKKNIHYKSPAINCYGIGPSDFLALIDKADCVISNSFHATVFSILFEKQFLTFGIKNNSARMETLLHMLALPEQHLVPANIKKITTKPFASHLDNHNLKKLRKYSENFLNSALKEDIENNN